MQTNKHGLSILQKGLILLLIPFILQVAVFVVLFTHIRAAERFSETQRKQADAVEATTSLVENFGLAWMSVYNNLFVRGDAIENSISPDVYRSRVAESMAKLRAMPDVAPNVQEILTETESVSQKQYDVLKKVYGEGRQAPSTEGLDLMRVLAQVKHIKPELKQTIVSMNSLKSRLDEERKTVRSARDEEVRRRSNDKNLSVAFLLFELLMTAGLVAFFLEDITKRLKVLVTNARLLPAEKPLVDTVGGADEIAYLDNVLHDASEKLIEAKQNRQAVVDMIAHDIRSPLMSSTLLLEALQRQTEAGEIDKCRATNESLKQTYKEILALVDDFLSLEKGEKTISINPKLFELKTVVETVASALRIQAEKRKVTVITRIESAKVIADELRVKQVLNNLISNAIKFSPPGSEILISSEDQSEYVKVSITDSGPGIPASDIPHLFERFYQGTNQTLAHGFGLGLAICRMIVESHGGEIGLKSELERGSTFWFTLPVDEL